MWLHKTPSSEKSTAKKNGLIWFWCNKYLRYTSHKSAECTKTTKREKSVAFVGVASVDVDVNLAGSIVSVFEWSESEDESLTPVRKKSRTKRAKKIKRKKHIILSSDNKSGSDE